MTNTSVVLGIATLGTPGAPPDCDCATDATGSIAMRKGIINFIVLASRFLSLLWLLASGRYNSGPQSAQRWSGLRACFQLVRSGENSWRFPYRFSLSLASSRSPVSYLPAPPALVHDYP